MSILVVVLLTALSFIAGMLGLGVAFIAIPVLGLFGYELMHVIMPWALLLNGVTAVAAAIKFMQKRMVDYRTAVPLLLVTTVAAPIGVYALRFADARTVWWIFVAVLVFLAYRMAFPPAQSDTDVGDLPTAKRVWAGGAGLGIGILAGFLGVGPGFLMLPTLVLLGYTARIAAATNALIVTLPSFSALAAHWPAARFDPWLVGASSVTCLIAAQAGAAFMARRVRSKTLTRMFAVLLGGLAVHRAFVLVQ